MSVWGDPVVVWSEAVIELIRWRSRRRSAARTADILSSEAEQYLASFAGEPPGDELFN